MHQFDKNKTGQATTLRGGRTTGWVATAGSTRGPVQVHVAADTTRVASRPPTSRINTMETSTLQLKAVSKLFARSWCMWVLKPSSFQETYPMASFVEFMTVAVTSFFSMLAWIFELDRCVQHDGTVQTSGNEIQQHHATRCRNKKNRGKTASRQNNNNGKHKAWWLLCSSSCA